MLEMAVSTAAHNFDKLRYCKRRDSQKSSFIFCFSWEKRNKFMERAKRMQYKLALPIKINARKSSFLNSHLKLWHTSPCTRRKSSLIRLNIDANPTLISIMNKSMKFHTNVAIIFNILPSTAHQMEYSKTSNNCTDSTRAYSSSVCVRFRQTVANRMVCKMLSMCSMDAQVSTMTVNSLMRMARRRFCVDWRHFGSAASTVSHCCINSGHFEASRRNKYSPHADDV